MKTTFVAAALVILASTVSWGLGLKVQAPELHPGDTWTLTSWTEQFAGKEGQYLVFNVPGTTIKRYRTLELNHVKDVRDGVEINKTEPHTGLLSFPLFVGKTWQGSYTNDILSGDVERDTSFMVVAYETVGTPAGSFQAFKIIGLDQRTDRPYGLEVTFWYAPEAKAIVKLSCVDTYDYEKIWDFELLKYQLQEQ